MYEQLKKIEINFRFTFRPCFLVIRSDLLRLLLVSVGRLVDAVALNTELATEPFRVVGLKILFEKFLSSENSF